jgi:predicted DNA binding protein
MRRLTVEFSGKELQESFSDLFGKVKSLEMLSILKMVPGEFAAVVKVELIDPAAKIQEFFPKQIGKIKTELLYEEKSIRTYFIHFSTKIQPSEEVLSTFGYLPYFSMPFEFKDGKLRVTVLGNSKQIRRYLEGLEKELTFHHKVISLMDAKFPASSPVSRLTEKQRNVLTTAYKLGYYDMPRRISSEELAKKFGLVKSTFVAHRRKAERRLLKEMLRES